MCTRMQTCMYGYRIRAFSLSPARRTRALHARSQNSKNWKVNERALLLVTLLPSRRPIAGGKEGICTFSSIRGIVSSAISYSKLTCSRCYWQWRQYKTTIQKRRVGIMPSRDTWLKYFKKYHEYCL